MEELRNAKGQTLAEFLAAYDVNKYPHPSVTSDTAVFTLQEAAGEPSGPGAVRFARGIFEYG